MIGPAGHRGLLTLGAVLLLTACGGAAPATPTVVAGVPASATPPPTATPPRPTPTPAPPTATLPPPATPTALATATASATATATASATPSATPGATATLTPTQPTVTLTAVLTATSPPPATAAPAPPGGVEQPPYGGSCGDYPCREDVAGWESRVRVPAGYTATIFAQLGERRPTSLAFGGDGRLYVAVQDGAILAVDVSGEISTVAGGFQTPTGIAFQPGTNRLFVSARLRDQSEGGEAGIFVVEGGGSSLLYGGLPCCYTHLHSAHGIAFGPDGFGYVGVGARADHGEILSGEAAGQLDELHPLEAAILRFNPAGGQIEAYAHGFRNPYDVAWDAAGGLYATDNAPDFGPPEELHRVTPGGQHGYPWYDCDVCFPAPVGVSVIPPRAIFVPHSSPTGLVAYQHNHFPGAFNSLFLTLWSAFPGAQKVVRLGPGGIGASNFATGFAAPIDVAVDGGGRLYVADWATGLIFQIRYEG